MKKFVFIFNLLFFVFASNSFAANNIYYDGGTNTVTFEQVNDDGCHINLNLGVWPLNQVSPNYGNVEYWRPQNDNNDTYMGSLPISVNLTGIIDSGSHTAYILSGCNEILASHNYIYGVSSGTQLIFPTPTPIMGGGGGYPEGNPEVLGATTDTITGFQGAMTDNLGLLIPIGAVLLISISVIYFVIKKFRKVSNVQTGSFSKPSNKDLFSADINQDPSYGKYK